MAMLASLVTSAVAPAFRRFLLLPPKLLLPLLLLALVSLVDLVVVNDIRSTCTLSTRLAIPFGLPFALGQGIGVGNLVDETTLETCREQLRLADSDGNSVLTRPEFVTYIFLVSDGAIPRRPFEELDLRLVVSFLTFSCECAYEPNAPPGCCEGSNAGINIADTFRDDRLLFLIELCTDLSEEVRDVLDDPGGGSWATSATPTSSPTLAPVPTAAPTSAPTFENELGVRFQYELTNDDGLDAEAVFSEVGNTLKRDLIRATTTIVIQTLNGTSSVAGGSGGVGGGGGGGEQGDVKSFSLFKKFDVRGDNPRVNNRGNTVDRYNNDNDVDRDEVGTRREMMIQQQQKQKQHKNLLPSAHPTSVPSDAVRTKRDAATASAMVGGGDTEETTTVPTPPPPPPPRVGEVGWNAEDDRIPFRRGGMIVIRAGGEKNEEEEKEVGAGRRPDDSTDGDHSYGHQDLLAPTETSFMNSSYSTIYLGSHRVVGHLALRQEEEKEGDEIKEKDEAMTDPIDDKDADADARDADADEPCGDNDQNVDGCNESPHRKTMKRRYLPSRQRRQRRLLRRLPPNGGSGDSAGRTEKPRQRKRYERQRRHGRQGGRGGEGGGEGKGVGRRRVSPKGHDSSGRVGQSGPYVRNGQEGDGNATASTGPTSTSKVMTMTTTASTKVGGGRADGGGGGGDGALSPASVGRRRTAYYSDIAPVEITRVINNPSCPTADAMTRCLVVFTKVRLFLEDGDDREEVRALIVGGMRRSFQDGSFVAALMQRVRVNVI